MAGTADVIIIGAGVIGCGIAYHLAKMGCRSIIVLEKDHIGSGSTGKCAGGIRQQFSTEINIKLSMESVRFFEHFEEETGYPADFRQNGYLMLATNQEEVEGFQRNVVRQRRLGLEVYLLSAIEAKKIVPQLNVEDVVGATYCPTDGYADPYSVVQGFALAGKRLGVRICEDTEVIDIKKAEGRLYSVSTSKDMFKTPVVVNSAGPYAAKVGKMLGIDIPIHPTRRHIFVTEPLTEPDKEAPMVIDFANGFWFRREGPCLIFGMRNPREREGFDISVDWGFLPDLAKVAVRRLPLLEDIGIVTGQAGLHDDTPDANAILGMVPDIDGVSVACGFSGHGFMHSPAVGRIMAEAILIDNMPSPDIFPLSLNRFKKQKRETEQVSI